MKKRIIVISFIIILFAVFSLYSPSSFAQDEVEYDPYAPTLKYSEDITVESQRERERHQLMARFLEQPFRPLGYATGRSAKFIERTHLPAKAVWFVDTLSTHGIFVKSKTPTEGSLGTIGLEGKVDVLKLAKIEQPFLSLEAFGGWAPNKDFDGSSAEIGGKYKIEPSQSSFFQDGMVRYRRSSAESFYGIGQDTSLGEHSTYEPEETWLEAGAGYHITPEVDAKASFAYQHMNIGNGNRERVGKIKEHFGTSNIPGINGGTLIGFVTSLKHDTRDHQGDTKRGGDQELKFDYFHDVEANDFHYFTVAGSARHFFPIFSDRRILALRITGEKNQEIGNSSQIPFFNLSRLGGADRTDGSELLRAYSHNRFFDEGMVSANVEYRYNIYEYGDFQTDAFGLFDVGEVFDELGDFAFEELKISGGGGLNIKYRRRTLWSFVVARSSEGWRTAAHTKISF